MPLELLPDPGSSTRAGFLSFAFGAFSRHDRGDVRKWKPVLPKLVYRVVDLLHVLPFQPARGRPAASLKFFHMTTSSARVFELKKKRGEIPQFRELARMVLRNINIIVFA